MYNWILQQSLVRQRKLNDKEKKLGGRAVYGINMFSDLTPQEFKGEYSGQNIGGLPFHAKKNASVTFVLLYIFICIWFTCFKLAFGAAYWMGRKIEKMSDQCKWILDLLRIHTCKYHKTKGWNWHVICWWIRQVLNAMHHFIKGCFLHALRILLCCSSYKKKIGHITIILSHKFDCIILQS